MYCVIQEIENKTVSYLSTSKRIEAYEGTYTIDSVTKTYYDYRYSKEKFDRPIKKAYKISIHESYREGRKVKKKQWVICTMGYYDMLDSWPGEHLIKKMLEKKLEEMGTCEETLWEMVYKKLDQIIKKVEAEFKQTEEYKAQQEQKQLLDKYWANKSKFEEKYGEDTYKYCYDVFGTLRNETYLNELKANYEAQQRYKRSYKSHEHSNYNYSSYGSYQAFKHSTYTAEEREMAEELIKQGFKTLSKKYHPDINTMENATEQFQQLANLKDHLLKLIKK